MSPDIRPRIPGSYLRLWLGLALIGVLVLGLIQLDRPWKRLQLSYLEALESVLETRATEQRAAAEQDLEFFRGEVRVALDGLRRHRNEIEDLDRQAFDLKARLREAEARWAEAEDAEAERAGRAEVEGLREMIQSQYDQKSLLLADLEKAELGLTEARAPLDTLEKRLRSLRRDAWMRAVPGLRLLAPSVTVRSQPGHRPERCVTCHLGMDPELAEPDVAGIAGRSVFAVHPRPELVGPSATPAHRDLACTDCHGGNGRSTDFVRAGHPGIASGSDGSTEVILAGPWIQASCVACHDDDEASLEPASSPGIAAEARSGREWIERLGCRACHQLGFSGVESPPEKLLRQPKVGPSLLSVGEKLSPEQVEKQLAAPSIHRPGSRMPELWPGRGKEAQEQAEIRTVVTYLFEKSRPAEGFQEPADFSGAVAQAADPRTGRDLFRGLGCIQCHRLSAGAGPPAAGPPAAGSPAAGSPAAGPPSVGPALQGLAERVGPQWLFRWLLRPGAWRHGTPMPDFRLSPEEAADLTAYLLDLGSEDGRPDPASTGPSRPEPEPAARDRRVLEILESQTTLEDAKARFDAMGSEQRTDFLARNTIQRLGCHGCHDIPGFETTPPPDGGDLRPYGRVLRSRLGSGDPPQLLDALKDHPGQWQLDQSVWRDMSIQILAGSTTLSPAQALSMTQALSRGESGPRSVAVPALDLMRRRGCFACHLPGGGEALLDAPSLHGIGSKLKTTFLHDYLADPGSYPPSRPWLEQRMPSFHFSAQELDLLTRFFVERAGAPLFDPPAERSPDQVKVDQVVGRAAYEALSCGRCHWNAPDVGLESAAPAPDYFAAIDRLRPSWVRQWILEPSSLEPTERMPDPFPRNEEGRRDTSALQLALEAPMFDLQRIRLEQVFETEAERRAYLDRAENVARAIEIYLRQN